MNILNKGRCSRCIASKKEHVILNFKEGENGKAVATKTGTWLFCFKYEMLCQSVAGFKCKEPPMGISADDYKKLNINENRRK